MLRFLHIEFYFVWQFGKYRNAYEVRERELCGYGHLVIYFHSILV